MLTLGGIHCQRDEHELAVGWFTKSAEAGVPTAMRSIGCYLEQGVGEAAPDYPAAAGWFRYGLADIACHAASSSIFKTLVS
jgi:TPR repeat protein